MILVISGMVAAFMLAIATISSPGQAARVGWALTMLVPPWICRYVGATEINSQTVVAGLAVVVIFLRPSRFKFPVFSWFDLVPLALMASSAISIAYNDSLGPTTVAKLAFLWVSPYVLGRLMVTGPEDLRELIPIAAALTTLLAMAFVFECVTGLNVWNAVLQHQGSLQSQSGQRFGLTRAEGPFSHPISAGLFLAISSPWVFTRTYQAIYQGCSKFWLLAPFMVAAGVGATLSRGPFMVFLSVIGGFAFYYYRPIRIPIVYTGIIAIAMAAVMLPSLVEMGESVESSNDIREIEIQGKTYVYSGSRHRYLLFPVYQEAIADAGWLGFGSWGTSAKHISYIHPDLRRLFGSIDNQYLLHYLNTGVVGTTTFFIMLVWLFVIFGRYAGQLKGETEFFTVASFSAVLGTSVILLTVWLASEFSFVFLLNIGLIAGLLGYARGLTETAPKRVQLFGRPLPSFDANGKAQSLPNAADQTFDKKGFN
ncbi:O-Antigen ligase [Planctomycetes bacterium CA13]|uniref:O-Antigen ligase n=1 Tax=Novipirellula herctigrandis TaxID=2527986 RepID=A0A5C5Z3P0_9BACT|nr:O-Antigen ligase [Planctomycetes bacterium CA13]